MTEGGLVQLDRPIEGEPLVGARAGEHQVADRASPDGLPFGAVLPGRFVGILFDREPEVIADQARELGLRVVGDRFQPGADRRVRSGAMGRRHRPVGRVAEEGVLEAELDLAGQAGGRPGEDQPAIGQPVELAADGRRPEGPADRRLPEHAADDRRFLEDPSFGERQGLDPGDEDRLDGVRNRARGRAAFEDVADRLLEEIGIALRPGHDR